MAKDIADKYDVPPDLFDAVITQESSWNPFPPVGKAGEVGLGQLTPGVYKSLGVNPWIPKENLTGSAKFLSSLYNQYGNWRDALSHYNGGVNLAKGRKYADKIIDKIGLKEDPNRSFTPVLDTIKSGGDVLKVPEVKALKDKKPESGQGSVMDKKDTLESAKDYFAKFGLWFLAGFLIIIGVWRVIK